MPAKWNGVLGLNGNLNRWEKTEWLVFGLACLDSKLKYCTGTTRPGLRCLVVSCWTLDPLIFTSLTSEYLSTLRRLDSPTSWPPGAVDKRRVVHGRMTAEQGANVVLESATLAAGSLCRRPRSK